MDAPIVLYLQVAINMTQPVDVIMSDSPAGAYSIATVDLSFQPLNGSEPAPIAFVIAAQVGLVVALTGSRALCAIVLSIGAFFTAAVYKPPLSEFLESWLMCFSLWQVMAGVDLFVNTSSANGTTRQSIAAQLSGTSCSLALAEVIIRIQIETFKYRV